MIKHYLKIAIRQISKNKVQYLLSIIGIAIGLLCFSMTTYYIRRFNSQFTAWSNSDRIANIYVKSTKNSYEQACIYGKELQELKNNPIVGIEKIAYSYGYDKANITICKEGQKEIPFQCGFLNITADFPAIYGMKTPEGQTPVLNQGEVWISESAALKMFGNENPIGKNLYFSRSDKDTSDIRYSTISAVICDLPEGTQEKKDLYFPETSTINSEWRYNNPVVLLAKDVASSEINKRLRKQIPPFGKENDNYLFVRTLQEELKKTDNLVATLLIPLIGALILIAAMINFLKFCIQSFYNRTKELSLRKCLGSDSLGLFYLLVSEITILFVLSSLTSFVLAEWAIPVYYQYLISHELINDDMLIHIPTLMKQEIEYLCILFIVCLLIAFWAVYRIKHLTLTEGIKGTKNQKHGIRNFMLGLQLFICFFFIAGAVGLGHIHRLTNEKRNNTLTKEECERIWKIDFWEPQFHGYEEEIVTRIRALAGVEDILLDNITGYPDYKTRREDVVHGIQYAVSKNYPDFMNLKIDGRMPHAPGEIAASRSLIWELEKEGEKNTSFVRLGDQTYQITGIYEQLPFEPQYSREQITKANQYHRFTFLSIPEKANYRKVYVKCIPGQEQNVRKEILRVIRSHLPESIPFELTTKQEECFRYNGGSELMSDLFTLLSIVSLIITVLGIYSAITLDTQSRQKEVAIRKINGAGPRAIALLFGKLYIRLLIIAAIPSLTIVYLFLLTLTRKEVIVSAQWLHNPFMWLGIILLTVTIVFITVASRIWLVSRLNPAEVIKSE